MRPHDMLGQRTTTSVDIGGATVRYADSASVNTMSLTPAVHARWDRATLGAVGSYSAFASGSWTVDGSIDVSVYSRSKRGFVGELSAAGGGIARADDARTGRGTVLARAHYMSEQFGTWAGAGLGAANDGVAWRPVRLAEAGVWGHVSAWTLLTSYSPATVDDTIGFADAQAAARWEGHRLEAGLSGGFRSGRRVPALGGTKRSWGTASLVINLTSYAALVASGGTYPVDLTQGFPGGRFASLAVRLGTTRARTVGRGEDTSRSASRASSVTTFHAESIGNGRLVLRVRVPSARTVEISGDFSSWDPLRLTNAGDGWWTTTVAVAPGTYQINVRIDGAAWAVPPGLVSVRDEFGGVFGLLVVR